MAHNTNGQGNRSSTILLLTIFVILAAVQYPFVFSWLQKISGQRAPSDPMSSSYQPGLFNMASAHKPQTIKFSDGSSRQRARQRILRQLTKTKGWERDTSHPRRRVLSALVGFLEYREKMEEAVRRKRDGWNKLTVRQKEVCCSFFSTTFFSFLYRVVIFIVGFRAHRVCLTTLLACQIYIKCRS